MPIGIITKKTNIERWSVSGLCRQTPSSLSLNKYRIKEDGNTKTQYLSSFAGEKDIKVEELISNEVKRLVEIVGKTFLDCEDIIKLTGIGRDNVRALMNSKMFPTTQIGNRKIVSILAFVTWQMTQ